MAAPPAAPAARYARLIPQTFECRPTAPGLQNNALPDELMVDWGGLPSGTQATIYLPAVTADDILALAGRLYCGQPFTKLDSHTISLRATGLTYVPIPPGPLPGPNYAGLLTLRLPSGLPIERRFRITVRQLTTINQGPRGTAAALRSTRIRQALGAFQINITIQSAASLLIPAERSLAFFRWLIGTLATTNRWYPVLLRYLSEIAITVKSLGGNPVFIAPSDVGAIPGASDGFLPPHDGAELEHTGKIERLIYDQFGDFESFLLETQEGERIYFHSRENHIAELARFVWQARILVTILSRKRDPHVPDRIILHTPTGASPG
jgi:hypothetical protein